MSFISYLTSSLTDRAQERSSAKRKAYFQNIQQKDIDKEDELTEVPSGRFPKQLLIDMMVRWASTYVMIDRAEGLKIVRTFYQCTFCYD